MRFGKLRCGQKSFLLQKIRQRVPARGIAHCDPESMEGDGCQIVMRIYCIIRIVHFIVFICMLSGHKSQNLIAKLLRDRINALDGPLLKRPGQIRANHSARFQHRECALFQNITDTMTPARIQFIDARASNGVLYLTKSFCRFQSIDK